MTPACSRRDARTIRRRQSAPATSAGRRRRLAGDRLVEPASELGTEQAVDDKVDARVDVDEQLGGRFQVEDDVAAAVASDGIADAVEHGERRLADDGDEHDGDQDEGDLARRVSRPTAYRAVRFPAPPAILHTYSTYIKRIYMARIKATCL